MFNLQRAFDDNREQYVFLRKLVGLKADPSFQHLIDLFERDLQRMDRANRSAQGQELMQSQGIAQYLDGLLATIRDAEKLGSGIRELEERENLREHASGAP